MKFQSLDSFSKSNKSESIVIVGNGPSLMNTPLNFKFPSFAMNRISMLYKETTWRPDYFLCTTTNIADSGWRADIMQSLDLQIPCFVWEDLLKNIPDHYTNIVPVKCAFGDVVTNEPSLSLWCENPLDSPVSKFGTSLLVAVQLAVFMGYSNIYLVGCDLNFSEPPLKIRVVRKLIYVLNKFTAGQGFTLDVNFNDANHFSPSYGTPGFKAKTLNENMQCAHDIIKLASSKYNFSVFNCSLSDGLKTYERIPISHILSA